MKREIYISSSSSSEEEDEEDEEGDEGDEEERLFSLPYISDGYNEQ